jgi:hypothetical protein
MTQPFIIERLRQQDKEKRKGKNLILKLGIPTSSLQSSELPQPAPGKERKCINCKFSLINVQHQ